MKEVYIGLGANLGDAKKTIVLATNKLKELEEVSFIQSSSLYLSKPWGPVKEQNDFINSVVKIKTNLSPLNLLKKLQEIENVFKRERSIRYGARTLDLDILLYGNDFISTKELTIPQAKLEGRVFVLSPLNEISPNLSLPSGKKVTELLLKIKEEITVLT